MFFRKYWFIFLKKEPNHWLFYQENQLTGVVHQLIPLGDFPMASTAGSTIDPASGWSPHFACKCHAHRPGRCWRKIPPSLVGMSLFIGNDKWELHSTEFHFSWMEWKLDEAMIGAHSWRKIGDVPLGKLLKSEGMLAVCQSDSAPWENVAAAPVHHVLCRFQTAMKRISTGFCTYLYKYIYIFI